MQRDTIFVSYSRADSSGRDALVKHLEVVLGKPPRVRIFADTSIETGEEWRNRIRDEMDRALVVVLLVSADFLTSEFVQSVEIPRAALAARRGEAVIACLYVRHCAANVFHIHVDDPNGEGFDIRVTDYQGLNAPNSPLMARKGAKREQLLAQAAGEIVELAEARLKEATRQQEAEAKLKAEEATRQREAEAKRKAEEATRQREAEAKREAEEATRQREAEAKREAEEATRQREAEAKRKAEEATRQREAEAKRRAEEATRQQEAEAKHKAEEERRQQEAEAKHKAEEDRRQREAEAKRKAEEERRQREAEAKHKAEALELKCVPSEDKVQKSQEEVQPERHEKPENHWRRLRWTPVPGVLLLALIGITASVIIPNQRGRLRTSEAIKRARQLALVMALYCEDHDSKLPPADSWPAAIASYTESAQEILTSPFDPSAGRAWAMNPSLQTTDVRGADRFVMLFEASFGGPPAGGPELLPEEPRGQDGYVIIFANYDVQCVPPDQVNELVWHR